MDVLEKRKMKPLSENSISSSKDLIGGEAKKRGIDEASHDGSSTGSKSARSSERDNRESTQWQDSRQRNSEMLRVKVKVTTPERGYEETLTEMIETMDQAEETIDDEAEAETEIMMGEEIAHTIATQGVIQAEEVAETEIETKAQDQVTTTPPKITLDTEKIADKITENDLMT
jgi:hypothetical protein